MSIIQRVPWRAQPQAQVEIDWSNPITRGLSLCALPGVTPVELTKQSSPVAMTYGKGAGSVRGTGAIGLRGDGTNNNYLLPRASFPISGDQSVFSIADFLSLTGNPSLLTKNGATTIPINHGIEDVTGRVFQYYLQSTPADRYWTSNSITVSTGQLLFVGMAAPANCSTAPRFFVNGSFENATDRSGTGTGTIADPTDVDVGIGNYSGAGGKINGNLYLVVRWSRQLVDAEFLSLYNNPWQLFAPLPRRIWAPSAAAATFNASWARGSTSIVGGGIHA